MLRGHDRRFATHAGPGSRVGRQEKPMFGFRRTAAPQSPSAAICHVIERSGLPSWITSSSMLRVVESRGRYAGRVVTWLADDAHLDVRGRRPEVPGGTR